MSVFRNIVFSACLAGLASGIVVTGVQRFGTVPLILQSEAYEQAAASAPAVHDHGAPAPGDTTSRETTADHAVEHGGWTPAEGFERTTSTLPRPTSSRRLGSRFSSPPAMSSSVAP